MSGAEKSRASLATTLAHWRAHHAREARDSLRRMVASPWSSLMSLLVVALALALPSSLSLLLGNAQSLSQSWAGQARISLYLQAGSNAETQTRLQQQLSLTAGVAQARLISPEQALDEFRQLSGYGEVLDVLGSNPLPAVIVVSPQDSSPAAVKVLRNRLAALPEVSAADIDLAWVERLAALLALGQHLLLALAGALAATVLLVIGNTIRLSFEARREEVRVLKLLGATDAFVRRPFLYTGFWTGLWGGLLACVCVSLFFFWLDGPASELARLYNSPLRLHGLDAGSAFGLLASSTLLGIAGAWLAIRPHLRAMEP